ncbi:TauD/TfdA family dioxygenase [Pseudomonas benzenivorans]|uniref:TauD/TfdA family dioxygenase n=1 Tax=Pseudomonas benzenivorans TaxID=556533 RepID=A0ABY5H9X2_9PSED|nr:TauD/TfdA family dioxygenase [Pseudomonas benzenivorans]UTW08177.1 TauD/TfdA family dioxygenase [Pseudomonas benzenivorans]
MENHASQIETPNIAVVAPHQFAKLGTAELFELVGEYGAVLFRNCIHSPEAFSELVKQHSSRLSLDPARQMVGGAAQLVDAGTQAVGLHCENGNSPFWPDLTWFYCHEAPRKGSQTTICDGEVVLARLSEPCRSFFEENAIRYSRTVSGEKWRRLVCHYKSESVDPRDVQIDDLLKIIDADENTRIAYDPAEDSIHYAFTVSAIQISSFSNRPAFANSILGPSFNYERPVIDTAHGHPIPAKFISEIETISTRSTHPIGWRDHDLVMIDNKRVMHGREPITDGRRIIFNALSYR